VRIGFDNRRHGNQHLLLFFLRLVGAPAGVPVTAASEQEPSQGDTSCANTSVVVLLYLHFTRHVRLSTRSHSRAVWQRLALPNLVSLVRLAAGHARGLERRKMCTGPYRRRLDPFGKIRSKPKDVCRFATACNLAISIRKQCSPSSISDNADGPD
jgi:hypothetical protein